MKNPQEMIQMEQLLSEKNLTNYNNFKFDILKFISNTILGSFHVLTLSSLLYPLQRAQIVRQIQNTYTSDSLKTSRCSHFGLRSTFRGLKITMLRNTMLYSIYQLINKFQFTSNKLAQNIMKGLVATSGFMLIYPLENIKIRMTADLEHQRFYSNIRDCIKKVKKHQGGKALYNGFIVGALHLTAQYSLIKVLINQKQKYSQFLSDPLMFSSLFITSFLGYQLLIYPLDTIKKNLQINGSLGHEDQNKKIRNVFKNLTIKNYYKGLPIRLVNSCFYTVLSLFLGNIGNQF